jgi:acetylornithine/succinyldiaminopimelate/putrescine aminotransferase
MLAGAWQADGLIHLTRRSIQAMKTRELIELEDRYGAHNYRPGGARRFCEALQARGVPAKETRTHITRFAPLLTINREEIDWALERVQDVLMMS